MGSLKTLMFLLLLALSLNLAACETTGKSQSQSGSAQVLGVQGSISRGGSSGFPTDAYWAP